MSLVACSSCVVCWHTAKLLREEPVCALLQAQQSELQSLLRLTESTEEGQGQDQPSSSFRSLVLDRAIPHALAQYIIALFTLPSQTQPSPKDSAESDSGVSFPNDRATTGSAAALPEGATGVQGQGPPDEGAPAPPLTPATPASEAVSATQLQTGGVSKADLNQQQAGSAERQAAGKEPAFRERGSQQWTKGIGMAGLPWALQLLAAFARGHQVAFFRPCMKVTHVQAL